MRKQPRGAAAVETAITMVVVVPLVFYALFIQDFLAYKLEGQEPTVAAPWDFVTPDFMRNDPGISGMNRLKYCDHTAAYDSYNRDFDCDNIGGSLGPAPGSSVTGSSQGNLGHHHATGAHQCWLGGGQQINCPIIRRDAALAEVFSSEAATTFGNSAWNRGGLAVCSARLNVFNSIIPKSLSSEGGWLWDRTQLTDKTRFGKKGGGDTQGLSGWDEQYGFNDVHLDGTSGDGSGSSSTGSWLLNTEEVALLVDPWALTHIEPIQPHSFAYMGVLKVSLPGSIPGVDQYHELLDRTGNYFNSYARSTNAVQDANDWHAAMVKRDLLDPASNEDVRGDYLGSVPVMWKKELTREGAPEGYASGWEDQRMQQVQRSTHYPSFWGPHQP